MDDHQLTLLWYEQQWAAFRTFVVQEGTKRAPLTPAQKVFFERCQAVLTLDRKVLDLQWDSIKNKLTTH